MKLEKPQVGVTVRLLYVMSPSLTTEKVVLLDPCSESRLRMVDIPELK